MEALFALLAIGFLVAFVAIPVALFVRFAALRQRVERLEGEIARLRYLESRGGGAAAARSPEPPDLAAPSAPEPAHAPRPDAFPPPPAPRPTIEAVPGWPPAPAPAARDEFPPPPAPRPAPAPAARDEFPPPPGPRREAAPRPEAAAFDASNFEQLVGGVWLQNVGSVVLLLGVFLMIVWGYTTGRLGPQVLVAAGVALGLALAWRGDRVARRTPRFGHALIGTGLGAVYLTLYLGFTSLHVFGPWVALSLLVLVSFGAIAAGLRYRVQAIAAFGVIGAFLPQFMARFLGMPGFEVTPLFLLGYLAAIDLLVFALAARAGWSGLDLVAIALSAFTWMAAFHQPEWGWGTQLGLSALFTVLGLAPLPRLVRVEGRVRGMDLAVIALAPLALVGASAPFLAWAERMPVALLLFGLAAIQMAAATWVDSRRPERDLWVPLTAAATLFATYGLERAIGPVYTSLAWAAEGLVLLVLGLRPRGGWLRGMGHAVLFLSALVLIANVVGDELGSGSRGLRDAFLSAPAVRDALVIAVLLAAGAVLARSRSRLTAFEQSAPEAWSLAGHALLAFWLAGQSHLLASDLLSPGGRFAAPPPIVGVSLAQRSDSLGWALAIVAWLGQAVVLAWRGPGTPAMPRAASLLLGFAAFVGLVLLGDGAWWADLRPILHRVSLLELLAIAIFVVLALRSSPRGGATADLDRVTARAWATAASLALMLWSVREMRHLAFVISRPDALLGDYSGTSLSSRERALAASLASVAWLLQAVLALAIGWMRDSAFLRWSGLVLMGLTAIKFLVFDLQNVDVFWRFLTAIVVGAAMLVFSYVYQRRSKAAK